MNEKQKKLILKRKNGRRGLKIGVSVEKWESWQLCICHFPDIV